MENNWWETSSSGIFNIQTSCPDTCPECGEEYIKPGYVPCTCPNMIYIPPGQHIHVVCPKHGKVKMYGSPVTF